MRRKEKQISDRKEIDKIIHTSPVCRLAMARDNEPYLIPLSFGYDGQFIYLHTAAAGKKIDFFEANPRVCFEFEDRIDLAVDDHQPCKWGFSFRTVIGWGAISEMTTPAEKETALEWIMAHYSSDQWTFNSKAVAKTRLWKITIDTLSGKQSP